MRRSRPSLRQPVITRQSRVTVIMILEKLKEMLCSWRWTSSNRTRSYGYTFWGSTHTGVQPLRRTLAPTWRTSQRAGWHQALFGCCGCRCARRRRGCRINTSGECFAKIGIRFSGSFHPAAMEPATHVSRSNLGSAKLCTRRKSFTTQKLTKLTLILFAKTGIWKLSYKFLIHWQMLEVHCAFTSFPV